jgi:Ca-activated chloride channel family protein
VNTKLIRVLALAIGAAAILLALVLRGGGSGGGTTGTTAAPPPADAVIVTVAYSPEKEALLGQAFAEFNATKPTVNGHPIVVQGKKVSSGTALDQLKAGTLQPTIWTPSSSLWGRLLTQTADVTWIPERNASFVRTPLVIAMWEEQAKALGWPKKALGWADVLAEASSTAGWGAHGHPEWGAFRLGHTNPDFSTSGLSAVAAEYYAATGKTEGLTLDDIADPAVRAKIKTIESSIVHYGDTTLFFAEQLAKHGPAFASAVAMEETTLVDFNTRLRKSGPRLVAIYPAEGTFFSDNPLITLQAPWVSADQAAAAAKLTDYLTSPAVQGKVAALGFRPASPDAPVGGTLTARNGVDLAQPARLLSLPDPKVLASIKALWQEDRKPADIVLVLDTSGSMNDDAKLQQAQEGLHRFLDAISPRDRVALIAFSDRSRLISPLAAMTPTARTTLLGEIDGLFPDGGTAVYDATLDGLALLGKDADPNHIAAEVVLTDGEDNKSQASPDDVVRKLGSTTEAGAVRVFTIAYGAAANVDVLKRIAEAGGGKPYTGDPQTIDAVYTSISSFF